MGAVEWGGQGSPKGLDLNFYPPTLPPPLSSETLGKLLNFLVSVC